MAERSEDKGDQKKVEGIERPAKEARYKSVALVVIKNLEKPGYSHVVYIDGPGGRSFKTATSELSRQLRKCFSKRLMPKPFSEHVLYFPMRYLVRAKLKPGQSRALLASIDNGSLGEGSIAGDEYIYNMSEARLAPDGVATWVETCFCDPPLAEERPYWEQYFDLFKVNDAHSRRNCRHENGTDAWACCNCDCTKKLEEALGKQGDSFLGSLRDKVAREPLAKLTAGD